MINKYYILDLAPGRSLIEHLVGGRQVFVISWRNPDARHRDWGADTYRAGDPGGAGATGGSAGPTGRCCWGCARVGS